MLKLIKVGHCFHPEAMVLGNWRFHKMKFPAYVGVIEHPRLGLILFDTGYAKRFTGATSTFPERFYRWLTPMHLCDKEGLIAQLNEIGYQAADVRHIFISHFHADHIAGLLDFPQSQFICSRKALEKFQKLSRISGLIKGFLPALLPPDFVSRCKFIEDAKTALLPRNMSPFSAAYDLFPNSGLLAVSLPGHAAGHYGLLLESKGKSRFLVGDAVWTQDAYISEVKPNRLSHIIMDSPTAYFETLGKLTEVYLANENIQLIPSHCQKAFNDFNEL